MCVSVCFRNHSEFARRTLYSGRKQWLCVHENSNRGVSHSSTDSWARFFYDSCSTRAHTIHTHIRILDTNEHGNRSLTFAQRKEFLMKFMASKQAMLWPSLTVYRHLSVLRMPSCISGEPSTKHIYVDGGIAWRYMCRFFSELNPILNRFSALTTNGEDEKIFGRILLFISVASYYDACRCGSQYPFAPFVRWKCVAANDRLADVPNSTKAIAIGWNQFRIKCRMDFWIKPNDIQMTKTIKSTICRKIRGCELKNNKQTQTLTLNVGYGEI